MSFSKKAVPTLKKEAAAAKKITKKIDTLFLKRYFSVKEFFSILNS